MKLLPQGSRLANSPFRRRHPTSEEIVEEVYRRVQTQQQQQQEGKSKLNSKTVNTSYASTNSSVDRSSMSSQSPESRTDAKIGRSELSKPKSDSRQKQRSITPFGRRRNNATSEKTSKLDVTQLVAEYTSHNPGLIIVNSPTPRQQSTTFVSVDGEIPAEVNPKDKRSTSPWPSIRRKKSLDSATTLQHRNTSRVKQQSNESSISTNLSKNKDQQNLVESRSPRNTRGTRVEALPLPVEPKKSPSRQARSTSPFFRRRNKDASELIADAKKKAIELSRLNERPSRSKLYRGDISLAGVAEADMKQRIPLSTSPAPPPRRARSLSPFTPRKSANEVIADVYRKMEIDYSTSTTSSSNEENGVEIVLSGMTDPSSSKGFLRRRTPLHSPSAINVLCKSSPTKHRQEEGETGGLETIATVLFKDPSERNNMKEDFGPRRQEKSIRGRKSILMTKTKPEKSQAKVMTADVSGTNTSKDTMNKASSLINASKKRRGLIPKFKTNGVTVPLDKNDMVSKKPELPNPKLRLELVPPSSIAVGGRSRVSELSAPNPQRSTTAIPLSSRVKTRSLGERSLAEIQTALEKVQQELIGATKAGQTVPRDLVMEKLLAVADTIEAPADRNNFLRKLSRLGSTISRSSGDGVTTSDDSDSSDDEDTSTDRGDTSGDESSFARWTLKRERKEARVGQWTRLLEALGLNGLWDDDVDIEDLDLSRESIDEDDDLDQTDNETTDRTPTPTPPIVQNNSFIGFVGQITSMGTFRDDTNDEPVAQREQQPQPQPQQKQQHQQQQQQDSSVRNIQEEINMKRKAQASERLKTLAANLQKERVQLNQGSVDKKEDSDNDIPENVIEMYVQELSAENKKAIAEEQRLRRVIEEEIIKQQLVDSVLKKVNEETLTNSKKAGASASVNKDDDVKINSINASHSTASNQDTLGDKKSVAESTVQSAWHPQLLKSSTRATLGSARSRFTRATSAKRSLRGSSNHPVQRDELAITNTGTSLGSASLISQPQMTLSTITANTGYTGYTVGTSPSALQQSNYRSALNGPSYSKTTDQFNSMSVMSEEETHCENQSTVYSQVSQPTVSLSTRRPVVTNQLRQNEPYVQDYATYDSSCDVNDDSYDDALSVGSIDSDQFHAGCQSSLGSGLFSDKTSGGKVYTFRLTDEERSNNR